jgi:hypothetical protein
MPPPAASGAIASTARANRELNLALHRIAVSQARVHPPARAYLERKRAEGKSRREALRCLKRLWLGSSGRSYGSPTPRE